MDAVAGASGATAPQPDGAPPASAPPPADTAQAHRAFFTPRLITATAFGGLAVASLATGVGFALASSSNAGTAKGYAGQSPPACADPSSPSCAQWKSAVNAQNADTSVAIVGYVATGVFAAAAVATLLLWHETPENVLLGSCPR